LQRQSKDTFCAQHIFHDLRFCNNSTIGNERTSTVTRCLRFLRCLLVLCSSPCDMPPPPPRVQAVPSSRGHSPQWHLAPSGIRNVCPAEQSYIPRSDISLELYISCLVTRRRLWQRRSVTLLRTTQPHGTAVQLGYNVMKAAEYFVSL
jgi:hypothetical protein